VRTRDRRIADIGGQHQPSPGVVGKPVRLRADGDLHHLGIGPRREHANRVLAAVGGEDELAVVAHQRARHGREVGYGEEMFRRGGIEHIDRAVGGVRDIDVAGRGVHGGVVEAAAAGVRRQRHMARERQRSLGHLASPGRRFA
jgi:hypothetical protein